MYTTITTAAIIAIATTIISYILGRKLSNNENRIKLTSLELRIKELQEKVLNDVCIIEKQNEEIKALSAESQVERTKATYNAEQLMETRRIAVEQQQADEERHKSEIERIKTTYEQRIEEIKATYAKQLHSIEEAHEKQLATLREMNKKQIESQAELIKEQITTTSETILKARQE
jgi:hypothetical protein